MKLHPKTHFLVGDDLIQIILKSRIWNDERGLTLIEVLVSFLILTMAMLTIMNSFALGGRQNACAYRYNAALAFAQSKMEEIKNNTFKNVVNVSSTDFSPESDYSRFAGFSYAVTVVNGGLNNKTVTVTVFYSDEGEPRQLALTSDITKR